MDGSDPSLAAEGLISSDANNLITKYVDMSTAILSPSSSCTTNMSKVNLTSKAITRRRSRACKKTPTTLLNANTTNFRALVQQHTGFHQPSCSTQMSLARQQGPINLNFGQPGRYQQNHEEYASLSKKFMHGQHDDYQPQQDQQQPLGYLYENSKNTMNYHVSLSSSTTQTPYDYNMENHHNGFLMDDNDFHSLHEFPSMGFSSNDVSNDFGYFS